MYAIKVEIVQNSVCRGCLSTDRQPVLLKTNTELYFNLLGDHQYGETKLFLCWECRGLLKKIQSFQNRIQQAQYILQQSLYSFDNGPVSNLSTLSSTKKDYYDDTIQYDDDAIEYVDNVQLETQVEEAKTEIIDDIVKQENEELYDDFKLEDVDDHSVTSIDKEYQKLNNETRRHSIKKYLSKAKVIDADIDLTDTSKYCTRMCLTEKEIEQVLERDRNSYQTLPFKCKQCKNAYKKEVDYKRHVTFNHMNRSRRLRCTFCKLTLRSWDDVEVHWRRHNTYYKCTLCGWLGRATFLMRTHITRNHAKLYSCSACDAICRTLREFSNHYKENHERIICDECGKSFVKKRTLETHIKRHHTPATCHVCNRTYAHYHVLENHYRLNHPHLVRGATSTDLSYCVECDKQFTSVYKYRRHLANAATHTPPKPVRIPCPDCGKVFARKIRMTNHYRAVHVKDTKHKCDICNKSFCSAYSARTHRQCVHDKIPLPKNKMCDICGRGFSTNRILSNHRRTHTGERPFKCPHCPATFAQRTAMKTHEKTQHKNVLADIR